MHSAESLNIERGHFAVVPRPECGLLEVKVKKKGIVASLTGKSETHVVRGYIHSFPHAPKPRSKYVPHVGKKEAAKKGITA